MAHGGIDKRANLKTAEHYNHMATTLKHLIDEACASINHAHDMEREAEERGEPLDCEEESTRAYDEGYGEGILYALRKMGLTDVIG